MLGDRICGAVEEVDIPVGRVVLRSDSELDGNTITGLITAALLLDEDERRLPGVEDATIVGEFEGICGVVDVVLGEGGLYNCGEVEIEDIEE